MEHTYNNADMDIIRYIKVFYKHWKTITVFTLISVISTFAISLSQPVRYEATATFFPIGIIGYRIQQMETSTMERQLRIEDLIISILKSRKMQERVVEELGLKEKWKKASIFQARERLKKSTKITLERNGIIKLSVRTRFPELSAEIANSYVDNLEYFNSQLDIGVQRKIVQTIDRAAVPEERMSRGTLLKTIIAGVVSFMFFMFFSFSVEYFKSIDIRNRLRE